MTESWKSVEEDSKANQSHAMQVSKEQPHTGGTCNGHAVVSEIDQMIAMNRAECRTVNRKHRAEQPRHPAKRRRPIRSGVRRYRWSHRNSPRAPTGPMPGETPIRKSETRTKDGNRPERHGARGATMQRELTMRPTQINGGGHGQDIARECQQSPPQKRTRLPPRRSEGRNE